MRILVTGGTGFIGSHICEQLARHGHIVVALIRRGSDDRFLRTLKGIVRADGDILDPRSVRKALDGVDGAVHCAGLIRGASYADFHRVNCDGTAVVAAEAVRQARLNRFVLVSSLAAAGPSTGGAPVNSRTTPAPATAYGRSKLEAERAVLRFRDQMEVTILRPPMVYGPRDTSALKYIRTISFGFMPYLGGWGANKVNVLYATDMGSACAMALKKKHPSGKTYCLNDGGTYIWRELLLEIQRALGRPAISGAPLPLRLLRYAASANERLSALTGRIPALTVDRLADLCEADWLGDSTDAENDLDWRPRTCWAEGIKLAVSWYREEGWLS